MPAKPVPGGCIENLPRCYWQQLKSLVTSSIIKSDVVPALRAGAAALAVGGTFILSGAALAAASEGLFVFIHRSFKDKDFPCSGAMQGIK